MPDPREMTVKKTIRLAEAVAQVPDGASIMLSAMTCA
jgi:acyl CoA:acetate/3-ketoacid CoA transferase alpha subunit